MPSARTLVSRFALCGFVLLTATASRATAAKPAIPLKPGVSHDGRAHSVWEAEQRERWRKALRGRGLRAGTRKHTLGTEDPIR